MTWKRVLAAVVAAPVAALATNVDVAPTVESVDVAYATLFKDEAFGVSASLSWADMEAPVETEGLYWEMSVDGVVMGSGLELLNSSRILPDSIACGEGVTSSSGTTSISVTVSLDASFDADSDFTSSGSAEVQAIGAGASLVPLILVLFVAIAVRQVELALFTGVFVGACMINGSLVDGFKRTLDTYILGAVADEGHQFVILFTLFLSGLVAMIQKTGGAFGLTKRLLRYARTPRLGHLIASASGLMLFFDDYSNLLVLGTTMRPIMDSLTFSREKLAWICDATAAPLASLSPISSWVGYEVSLIQTELDKIVADNDGVPPEGLETNGYAVFLDSIAYRYYPIFLIVFQIALAAMQRDFGPMLIAERKTRVTGRTDGGDGAFNKGTAVEAELAPRKGTPPRVWNMLVPIGLLISLIFYLLVATGASASEPGADFLTKIQNSDSYAALLYGTMGTAMCTLLFYMVQFVQDGQIVAPTPKRIWKAIRAPPAEEEEQAELEGASDAGSVSVDEGQVTAAPSADSGSSNGAKADAVARPLLSPLGSVEAFLQGLATLFPAVIVLTLAWSVGSIMTDVGCDRLFARVIVGGVDPGMLPTLTFVISAIMALAMGTSWGVMSIMFPLVVANTWYATDGDVVIFNSVIAAVLAGAVAGDQSSIISDTSVLASMSSRCDLMAHVKTQAPYAFTVVVLSILLGTLPVGLKGYSTGVAILLGFVVTIATCFVLGAPIVCKSGRFDIFTELYMRCGKQDALAELKSATADFAETGVPQVLAAATAGAEAYEVNKTEPEEPEAADAAAKLEIDALAQV